LDANETAAGENSVKTGVVYRDYLIKKLAISCHLDKMCGEYL
jgi:hypothetical protein